MAEMLRRLRDEAARITGETVSSAVVSIPHLIAVYQEDMDDALKYIGVKSEHGYVDQYPTYQSLATHAGYGWGLCQNFTDICGCLNETVSAKAKKYMMLLYTEEALVITMPFISHAYATSEAPVALQDLGNGRLASLKTHPEIDSYWAEFRTAIEQSRRYRQPETIFLTGESALHPDLEPNIVKALNADTSYPSADPTFFRQHPEYINALGEADFAKRAPYTGWYSSC